MANDDFFRCPHPRCESKFTQVTGLLFHKRTAHGSLYKCKTCGEGCGTAGELAVHSATYHNGQARSAPAFPVKEHECRQCGALCASGAALRVHLQKHAGEATVIHSCVAPGCGASAFLSLDELKCHVKGADRHDMAHSAIRFCSLGHCGRVFPNATLLRAHQVLDHGMPLACHFPQCKRTYSRLSGLSSHIRDAHLRYLLPSLLGDDAPMPVARRCASVGPYGEQCTSHAPAQKKRPSSMLSRLSTSQGMLDANAKQSKGVVEDDEEGTDDGSESSSRLRSSRDARRAKETQQGTDEATATLCESLAGSVVRRSSGRVRRTRMRKRVTADTDPILMSLLEPGRPNKRKSPKKAPVVTPDSFSSPLVAPLSPLANDPVADEMNKLIEGLSVTSPLKRQCAGIARPQSAPPDLRVSPRALITMMMEDDIDEPPSPDELIARLPWPESSSPSTPLRSSDAQVTEDDSGPSTPRTHIIVDDEPTTPSPAHSTSDEAISDLDLQPAPPKTPVNRDFRFADLDANSPEETRACTFSILQARIVHHITGKENTD